MLNFFTPLYLLALYGMVRFLMRPKDDELKDNQINWGPLAAISVTLFLYFGAQLVAALILYAYGAVQGWSTSQLSSWTDSSVIAQFLFVLMVEALTVYLLYKFLKRRKASFKTIGLIKPKWADVAYALIGFAVYFAVLLVVLQLSKTLIPSLNIDQQQQVGFNSATSQQLPLVFVSLVILPPITEELLIRGFLYSGLKRNLPKVWAVLIASGLFGIAHLQAGSGAKLLWVAAIDTFVLSLILIYLREKTGGLWASIYLHTIKNGVAFLALFVFASHVLK